MRRAAGPFARRLVVMVKAPVCGRVKTRLAREIGAVPATAFYRHATCATLSRLATDRRWLTVLAAAPDAAIASRFWPRARTLIGQGRGDLGARMQRIMDHMPPGPVVIVGTDVPGIRPAHIAAAFVALGRHDAVFGPATDGGYWLIGFKRRPSVPRAFKGVRWSSAETLADNRAALAGLNVAEVATLADVDVVSDLAAAGNSGTRLVLPLQVTAHG